MYVCMYVSIYVLQYLHRKLYIYLSLDILIRWMMPEESIITWTGKNVLASCIAYQNQLSFFLLSSPNPNAHAANSADKEDAYILPYDEILIKGNCVNSSAVAQSLPGMYECM